MKTAPWIFFSLSLLACLSLFFSVLEGSAHLSISQIFSSLHERSSINHAILFNIRLPETLTAFTVGGLLGLAGALMQILLRNPLADPYILGTSGGAALVTLFLMLFGISGILLTVGAWLGSLITIGLILFLTRKKLASHSDQLILTGIAFSSITAALMSVILFLSPDHEMRSMLFWLVGDLSETHLPFIGLSILIAGLICSLKISPQLNILVRGEKESLALGIQVKQLKYFLILLTTLLTAAAVTLAGCIGFIGLIVPHLLRLVLGYRHQILLPACVLAGGTLLTCADTLSRVVLAPQQLPVGIFMTLIGIPLFLILLNKKNEF